VFIHSFTMSENMCTFNDVLLYDVIVIVHKSMPVVDILSHIHPHLYTIFKD
jgi:hypothetical protein